VSGSCRKSAGEARATPVIRTVARPATNLAGLLRRPLSEQLQRQLRGLGIDLHLIGEPAAEPAPEPKRLDCRLHPGR